jgi:amino acid transporter
MPESVPPDPGRDETAEERDDRNLTELLQELRVAGLGIQVLFGFLLSIPFTNRFQDLDRTQRDLYVTSVLLAAAAILLLTAPVAYHRVVFRQHRKERLVRWANRTAIAGLACVAAAVSVAVGLVVSFVATGLLVVLTATIVPAAFAGIWFVLPITSRSASGPRPAGDASKPDG